MSSGKSFIIINIGLRKIKKKLIQISKFHFLKWPQAAYLTLFLLLVVHLGLLQCLFECADTQNFSIGRSSVFSLQP